MKKKCPSCGSSDYHVGVNVDRDSNPLGEMKVCNKCDTSFDEVTFAKKNTVSILTVSGSAAQQNAVVSFMQFRKIPFKLERR